ncbi:hypothetical protein [Streptomyces kanamyceticus]|uniref:Uncharacterized protein n=1 Tax=Streptomyces kanamyceticus TaxID=1967 RepID=A0A5J6GB13_STRKN|nr:hypothetical protein [Streptomyces kanamyceticus]QEU91155.1 hypothetical protein CP970_09910 [Streptomyces kanamyceticus]
MPEEVQKRTRVASVAEGVAALAALVAIGTSGDWIWRHGVALCPGGGHVFAVVIGILCFVAVMVASEARRRVRAIGGGSARVVGPALLAAVAAVIGTCAVAAVLSCFPGRNGKPLGSLFQGGPMWVEENPDVSRSLLLGLAIGLAAVVTAGLLRRPSGRRRAVR